jgi:metal-responsive CopG/Arc/MetJ family transcriptional regulator
MISARIPTEVLAKLDEWAANNESTRSAAVAELLAKALARESAVPVKRPRKPKAD